MSSKYAITITDIDGQEHEGRPMVLADVARLEKRLGTPLVKTLETAGASDWIFLLWCLLKHEGLTEEQVAEKFTMGAVADACIAAMKFSAAKHDLDFN